MDKIRNILLIILFFQLLIFLYVKLIHEETPSLVMNNNVITLESLIDDSINEIIYGVKKLPQSSEYTLWDKKMIAKLNHEIQIFNDEMKKIVDESMPIQNNKEIESIKIAKIITKTRTKEATLKVSLSKKVETYAKEKLGQKYVWGATGPKSFDCSGFTREVFLGTTGIKIPRVSRDQAKVGLHVDYQKLKRGDMVFFDTEKKYTGRVNHVGIYLNNGNFIHASSAKKKVIITNFKKKPFYKKRFLWGRRIVKHKS
ncbi:MAG: Peptidoglycan lytic protein P45 [uncultured Sulfurovum sp.]|uniref:Peptidoglycan lytic protein P45 n=1 Tax=uncultured Sulfurovum sp. TaxID=269237 RepID=A0A6S6SA72_9BACT|nr:MAG: Peptidoglycan lytic protein P45 [uncultured Sulfurovum sp.]